MPRTLSILYLEDVGQDVELVTALLAGEGFDPSVAHVQSRETYLAALEKRNFELILSDYTLPSFDGITALSLAKEKCPDIPFIFVTGTLGEELAIEMLKNGATDYVLKHRLARLVPAVKRALDEMAERKARKEAEKKLRQSEKLQLVGQMAASIIHDFRGPLQILQGSAEIMMFSQTTEEQRIRRFQIIRQQIQRMSNMAHDLLDFAKGQTRLTKAVVDIGEFLQEVAFQGGEIVRDSKVQFAAEQKNAFQLMADKDKLLRVLINLIRNAKEAMAQGGSIKVTVSLEGMEGVIRVADNGPGMPPELHGRLFEPFATFGKAGGTGLGLALSKKIIQDHNGAIDCHSVPGKGTTFIIRLPAAEKVTVQSPNDQGTSKIII